MGTPPVAPPDLLLRLLTERLELEKAEGKNAQDADVRLFLSPLHARR